MHALTTPRPIQIYIACALLLLSLAYSTYSDFFNPAAVVFGSKTLGTLGAQLAGALVNLMLILCLFLRQNWARYLYLALIAFSLVLELIMEVTVSSLDIPRNAQYFFNLTSSLLVVVLLFLPSSSNWYRPKL